jgi:hypothetical protein
MASPRDASDQKAGGHETGSLVLERTLDGTTGEGSWALGPNRQN